MANTTETATFNVKSNIGEVGKEATNAAADFKVMGLSLNGVKAGFASAAVTAKGMFGSIKAGLISTGIGAFIVLIGSLFAYFTNTKKGADMLQRAMAGLGAVVDVLTDAFSELGGIIVDTFQDPMPALESFGKGLLEFIKDPTGSTRDMFIKAAIATKNFTDELVKETDAMMALKKRTQELRDADMEFMIQKALTRKEIEKARLVAEDETKSAEERLQNLTKALKLEEKTTLRELELARERMEIQKQEMLLSENLVEDEQKLAELKTAIIEKETASIKMRRRVITEVNALENEISAAKLARDKEDQDAIDLKIEKTKSEADILLALQQENSLALIENLQDRALAELKIQEDKEIASAELLENSEEVKKAIREKFARLEGNITKKTSEDAVKFSDMSATEQLGIASSTAGNMSKILGEETAAGQAFAITQATIDTYASAQSAYKSMSGIPVVGPALGAIAAAAAIAGGIANVASIKGASSSGPSGGGGGRGGGAVAATPAPQMMSGSFDLTGAVAPEPVKAFVLTDEMSNSQNQLANIRRRATI